jgi:hypothetical protein
MNVEIRAEAALFPEKEYISGIFFAVLVKLLDCMQCGNGGVKVELSTLHYPH